MHNRIKIQNILAARKYGPTCTDAKFSSNNILYLGFTHSFHKFKTASTCLHRNSRVCQLRVLVDHTLVCKPGRALYLLPENVFSE